MRRHPWPLTLALAPALLALAGCGGNPPSVVKGSFTGKKELSIRRGLVDIVVETDGQASYVVRQWPYTHPMGQPGDTEIVVSTPAGQFTIENFDLGGGKFRINGQEFEYQPAPTGQRMTMRIDNAGKISRISDLDPEWKKPAPPAEEK